MRGRLHRSQSEEGFRALLEESIRWPYQRSFGFPEASRVPVKIQRSRKPKGDLQFPSHKMHQDVACESKAEFDFCSHLDCMKHVLHFFEQPDPIYYRFDNSTRPYYPDFMFSFIDGRSVVVEVKQDRDIVLFKNIAKWEALARYCETKGFGFYIGDAHDSVFRLLHTPIPVQLLRVLEDAVTSGPIIWSDAQAIRDNCRAANRLLIAALLRGSFVVEQGFSIRAAAAMEREILETFRSWMADVNELPTIGRPGHVPSATRLVRGAGKRYPNSFKRWSESEEIRLVQLFQELDDLNEVARALGRSPNAIGIRLESLGLVPKQRTGTH